MNIRLSQSQINNCEVLLYFFLYIGFIFDQVMSCLSCGCLEYAGRSAWRVIKVIVGVAALVSAILVFTPVVCSPGCAGGEATCALQNVIDVQKYVRYAISVILLLAALGILIDSLGVEAVLNKFRLQISRLSGEVDRLEDVEEKLSETSDELITRNNELMTRNNRYKKLNDQHEANNSALSSEVGRLKQMNDATSARVLILESTARQFMQTLAEGGDDFRKFGEIFKSSALMMQDSAEAMNIMMHEIAADKFGEIDFNKDGLIDEDELRVYAESTARTRADKKKG